MGTSGLTTNSMRMTEDEFRFHALGALQRITQAIERISPPPLPKPIPRPLDVGDLTQMSHTTRQRLTDQWHKEDEQKKFEPQ
jgi:hypothetical protein